MPRFVTYGTNQKGNKTLIDDKKYEYNFEKDYKGKRYWWYLVDAASSANNTTRAVNIRRKETRQKI